MNKVEAIKARIERDKKELSKARREMRKQERKVRDTAIYTVGGCFEAMMLNPDMKETALNIWNTYFAKVAPTLYSDRRRQALEDTFDLELPAPPSHPQQSSSDGNHGEG